MPIETSLLFNLPDGLEVTSTAVAEVLGPPRFCPRGGLAVCPRPLQSGEERARRTHSYSPGQASPTAETLYGLAQAFMHMIRHLKGERLDDWLSCVRASQIPELQPLGKEHRTRQSRRPRWSHLASQQWCC